MLMYASSHSVYVDGSFFRKGMRLTPGGREAGALRPGTAHPGPVAGQGESPKEVAGVVVGLGTLIVTLKFSSWGPPKIKARTRVLPCLCCSITNCPLGGSEKNAPRGQLFSLSFVICLRARALVALRRGGLSPATAAAMVRGEKPSAIWVAQRK